MARDYIDIGCTPCEEDCAQVGEPDYDRKAWSECNRFIDLLRRTVGPEPEGAQLSVKPNPHDFGTYYEVVCYYDTDNEAATQYAYRCERDVPARWDDAPAGGQPAADPVCNSCLSAAAEEGISDRDSQVLIMTSMGADVPNHLCDQVEDPSPGSSPGQALGFRCLCACRQRR